MFLRRIRKTIHIWETGFNMVARISKFTFDTITSVWCQFHHYGQSNRKIAGALFVVWWMSFDHSLDKNAWYVYGFQLDHSSPTVT